MLQLLEPQFDLTHHRAYHRAKARWLWPALADTYRAPSLVEPATVLNVVRGWCGHLLGNTSNLPFTILVSMQRRRLLPADRRRRLVSVLLRLLGRPDHNASSRSRSRSSSSSINVHRNKHQHRFVFQQISFMQTRKWWAVVKYCDGFTDWWHCQSAEYFPSCTVICHNIIQYYFLKLNWPKPKKLAEQGILWVLDQRKYDHIL